MDTGNITLLTAFGAGVISFLSPCVLPILPTYAAFLAGTGLEGEKKGNQLRFLANSIFFLSGFTAVFVAMGATASYFGQFFIDYQDAIRKSGALFMIIMGIHLSGLISFSRLHREYRPFLQNTFRGPLGAFILGIAFTAGWTPCTGPILASILIYAGTSGTVSQGAFLLFVYAMGFSVPFFVIALFLNRYVGRIRALYVWLPVIQKVAATVLVITGVVIFFDLMQRGLGLFWGILG